LKTNFGDFENMSNFERSEQITTTEEMINLYEEMMMPVKELTVSADDLLYQPVCIGILSRWPWYELLKDWLCRNYQVLKHQYDVKSITCSLER
jgi:hypothetical protein